MNKGAAYPASPLTIMIPREIRIKMGGAPEQELKDKNVYVVGRVILFKGKPEIIVYDKSQISLQ